LRQPDAIFARNLFGATPADDVRPVASRIAVFSRYINPEWLAPSILRYVEVRLVERKRFDERRDLAMDRQHLLGHQAILGEVRRHDHQAGTEANGSAHRHGRSDTVPTRLVAGGCDHPS